MLIKKQNKSYYGVDHSKNAGQVSAVVNGRI